MENFMFFDAVQDLEDAEDNAVVRQNLNMDIGDPLNTMTNDQFRKTFRLSKELFEYLEDILRPYLRQGPHRTDISKRKKVIIIMAKYLKYLCFRVCKFQILIGLRFFASGSYQMDIGYNCYWGLSQSSVSRCIKEVVTALNQPNIFNEWVKFPRNIDELNDVRLR